MTWPSLALLLLTLPATDGPEPIGRIDHPELVELSGLVASRRYPGIFWAHNDSGNPPALFAVRLDGTVVRRYDVAVPNIDWEDLALDDQGRIYLGEIGNNGGLLPLRAVYRLDEPDPGQPPDGPLRPTWTSIYGFGDSGRFDAESLAVVGDALLLVAKRRDEACALLYRLPLDRPGTLLRPALPEPAGRLPGFRDPATGADLSPDGRRLAVCGTGVVVVYESDAPEGWREVGRVEFRAGQVEAVAWAGDDLILANEKGRLLRVPASAWRKGTTRR